MSKAYLAVAVLIFCSFNSKKNKVKIPENFVLIPSMNVDLPNKTYSVNSFFMLKNEVTNAQYREFVDDVKRSGDEKMLKAIQMDTSAWKKIGMYADPMANMYAWHPAYDQYPAVNITKEGAYMYCEWMTKKLRERYGDHLNDVRIPTKHEWIAAAKGGLNAEYPWGHSNLIDSKGCYLANFLIIGDQNIRKTAKGFEVVRDSTFLIDQALDGSMLTAPTESYWPNGYGLYNMSGNVAELCDEGVVMGGHWATTGYDIRVTSEAEFEKANPYVGFRPIITFSVPK